MKELNTFRQYLTEGIIKENTLEKLADITFESAEGNQGSAKVYEFDFEDNEALFNKAHSIINDGTSSLSSGNFNYKFSTGNDKLGKFIKLSFKYKD